MTQAALEKGLAITEGELPVFIILPETGEYLYQSTEYHGALEWGFRQTAVLMLLFRPERGYSVYRDTKQGLWVYVENHCGETVF